MPDPTFTPTTDPSDAHPDALVLAPVLRDYGGRPRFHGPAVTLRIDNGGSLNCAVLGGMLAGFGVQNG